MPLGILHLPKIRVKSKVKTAPKKQIFSQSKEKTYTSFEPKLFILFFRSMLLKPTLEMELGMKQVSEK